MTVTQSVTHSDSNTCYDTQCDIKCNTHHGLLTEVFSSDWALLYCLDSIQLFLEVPLCQATKWSHRN